MIDEESCWISIHDAVALMETMLQCYRGMAVDLLRQAVMDLKVKSKTVNSSPRYLVSDMAGTEVIHSDGGQRIEVCRKDVVEFCLNFNTPQSDHAKVNQHFRIVSPRQLPRYGPERKLPMERAPVTIKLMNGLYRTR
jgi:hypothetical protein